MFNLWLSNKVKFHTLNKLHNSSKKNSIKYVVYFYKPLDYSFVTLSGAQTSHGNCLISKYIRF